MSFFELFSHHIRANPLSVFNIDMSSPQPESDRNIDGQHHDQDKRFTHKIPGDDAGDLRTRELPTPQTTNTSDFQADILIVEDEGIVALDIKNTLIRLGYRVTAVASTGWDAIHQATRTKPDLVLMDIRLHGEMDGIEAAAYIRQELAIPIIFLTAQADEMTRKRAEAVAHAGYLLKPFSTRDLENSLAIALLSPGNTQSEE